VTKAINDDDNDDSSVINIIIIYGFHHYSNLLMSPKNIIWYRAKGSDVVQRGNHWHGGK